MLCSATFLLSRVRFSTLICKSLARLAYLASDRLTDEYSCHLLLYSHIFFARNIVFEKIANKNNMKNEVTMRKIFISPSILTADFARLEQECKSLEKCGADWIHCDVMDGNFVPNLTFGMPIVKSIRKCVVLPLDVHLMIERPERYIEQFAEAGANLITIHAEATDDVAGCLKLIRACGKQAGISVKPNTPVDVLEQYRGLFDMILIMSVEPGFGGQSFIESSVDKIRRAKELFPDVLVEVDGGINKITVKKVIEAGADVIVAGSAIINAHDRHNAIEELRKN